MPRRPCAAVLAAVLAGCTVGPSYVADRPTLPAAFGEHPATPAEVARTEAEQRAWWASFHDPLLDALVEQAIGGNLELRAEAQRIIEARAARNEERAAFYPQVDFNTEFAEQHFSSTVEYPPLPNANLFNRQYQGGPQISWELDVFGRIRREVQARDAELQATIEERSGALVSLLAELANQYMTLRSAQARLRIAQDDVRIAADGLQLTQRTFAQGLGTTLQIAQAQGQLDTVRAELSPLHTAIERAAHAIGVLTGQLPERDVAMLETPAPMPAIPALPAALPSIVIARRPDIREAERRYAASVARVGVAVADLYPRFNLPLYALPESSEIHTLFSSASLVWQAAIAIDAPLYTGGRLRNQVIAARAEAEDARLSYEQTVLRAFGEVEDAISAYRDDAIRLVELRRAAADNRLALTRAQALYSHGLSGFLDVLTAERSVSAADDALALGQLALTTDAVALFRAIGAGWQGVDWDRPELPVSPALEIEAAAAARATAPPPAPLRPRDLQPPPR